MTPLPFHNWVATTLVFGPSVLDVAVEHRRFRGDLLRSGTDPTYWRLQVWELGAVGLASVLAITLPDVGLGSSEWLWVAIGCVVSSVGVALRLWSIHVLGRHFTRYVQVSDGQRLVRTGPYARLRHPSYTGAILMLGGIGIGLGNAVSAVASFTVSTLGFLERIRREEALLHEFFGAEYGVYSRETRRLVPGVW